MAHPLWKTISSPEDLLSNATIYMQKERFPANLICDHICYRVETIERYEELKELFKKYSHLANESLVNGRPICIFQLPSPIEASGIKTDCIELPAPKENSFYKEGWEHAEFVTNENLKEWLTKHPNLPFDTRSLNKTINAEVSLKISETYKIKFHEKHILDVIKEELNDK
jgi:uncharacterized protein